MLKYIEVLRAIEHVMYDPFLSHEEGVAILRDRAVGGAGKVDVPIGRVPVSARQSNGISRPSTSG